MENRSQIYEINRPGPRHGHKSVWENFEFVNAYEFVNVY